MCEITLKLICRTFLHELSMRQTKTHLNDMIVLIVNMLLCNETRQLERMKQFTN